MNRFDIEDRSEEKELEQAQEYHPCRCEGGIGRCAACWDEDSQDEVEVEE